MTLEYRCSNCGTLLQTTNAEPLDVEIERLHAEIKKMRSLPRSGDVEEIERLRVALQPFAHVGKFWRNDPTPNDKRLVVDDCNNTLDDGHDLDVGDFRRALAAYEQKGDGK